MTDQNHPILVVDDELGIREGCRRILTRQGYEVGLAINGEDGWQKMQSGKYHLALLDVMMPDISGHQWHRASPARCSPRL